MRALLVVLVLATAACSDDGDGDRAAPTTATSTATSTTAATATSSSTPARAEGDRGSGAFTFRMPSGNIWCSVDEAEARCDITDTSWQPPPKPADCTLDWGNAVSVDRRDAAFVCAGDTVQDDNAPVLPYGGVVERGDLRCRSEEQGVTCEHRSAGHRFLLSRARYELD